MRLLLEAVRWLGWKRGRRLVSIHRWVWQETIQGFHNTRILQTLFSTGFLDELLSAGSVEVAAFAAREQLDERILQTLCDALYSSSILDRSGDRYQLTAKGRSLVEVARGWFEGTHGYSDVMHHLEALLRKEKAYGRDVDRHLLQVIKGTNEISSWIHFPLALHLLQKTGCHTVLDLGCGDGGFLRYLYTHGGIRGVGIDAAADVVHYGTEQLQKDGLDRVIQLYTADVTNLAAGHEWPAFDAATAMFFWHEVLACGFDVALRALQDYRRLFPSVPMVVFEVDFPLVEELRRRPGMMVQYMVQHDLSNQHLASQLEWRALFQAAGFRIVEEFQISAMRVSTFTLI